jgi:hypothetical protein
MRRSRPVSLPRLAVVLGSLLLVLGFAPGASADGPLKEAAITWIYAPSPVSEGTPVWFDATFDSTDVPAFGTVRIREASTGEILASTEVTGTHALVRNDQIRLWPVGAHELVAEFVGDPTFVQASATTTIDVVPDTVVEANVFPLNVSTFYPLADGYRNRLGISGQCSEFSGCSPKVEIYTDTNRIVRRWILPDISQNQYKVSWDGRTASGTLLRAGRYRIHHTIHDWAGNVLVVDQWVTLSHRTVRWVTVSTTWSGGSYTTSDVGGSGWISRAASSYAGGVRIGVHAATHGGYAWIADRDRLVVGLAHRAMKVSVLGRTLQAGNTAFVWCSPTSQAETIRTVYQWYTVPVSSSCWPQGVAHPIVQVYGTHALTVDVAKIRFVYQYAVWAT